MKLRHIADFITSPTARLAESYLLIIMVMSIGFSFAFYNTSSIQLGRQIPPDSIYRQQLGKDNDIVGEQRLTPRHDIDDFLHSRIIEGRTALQHRLLYLNTVTLAVGAVVSYYLARRTLRPIEAAMDAQVQFVSDASHELRTPLTAIKTGNDVALRNQKLTLTEAKQVITQNTVDIERLKALSDGLLSLAKNDQAKLVLSKVGLQDIVAQAMTQVIPQATERHIAVEDEVADLKIVGNQPALEQVLVILLDNAIKYSSKNSTVQLKTRRRGKYLYLDVIDHGIGIRASDVPHLFRRFYRADYSRTSGERNGYGLGLSIAQRIMQSHGSSIGIASKLGTGSTFTLKLMLA